MFYLKCRTNNTCSTQANFARSAGYGTIVRRWGAVVRGQGTIIRRYGTAVRGTE